jgi:predicted HD superfamily hydrolase involved in NAD metabolism
MTIVRERVLAWLADNVSAHRLQHILGVEAMCIKLACLYRVDEEKAATAGLMHDLAKFFKPQRLLEMAIAEGIAIDSICADRPHLLHADVGAIVAREEFGIFDEEILDAIRNHTLGSPGMSKLSCIVFVADALEPNRGDNLQLELMRQTSRKNLYQSVQQTCDYSIKYLLNTKCIIHPRVISTRNWALTLAMREIPKKTKLL